MWMYFLIVFCYILVAYGACNVIAFGEGPFHVFSRLRDWAYGISDHFAKMFTCMMCLPANFGWICSLVNWFFIPVAFTPFNIIFAGFPKLWFLALLCDGAFTTGIVYLIYILNEYLEKKIDYYEQNTYRNENNVIGFDSAEKDGKMLIVEDITIDNYNSDGRK
jgi:hypothetical protein